MCYKIASNFVQPHTRKGKNVRRKKREKGQKQGIWGGGGGGGKRLIRKIKWVCHFVALPFTLKNILKQKKKMKTQIFHHAKL